jgi:hypothetical protein
MLVKSAKSEDHIADLKEDMVSLRRSHGKLPNKIEEFIKSELVIII